MITKERLAYIEKLSSNATPGPWKYDCGNQTIEYEGDGCEIVLPSGTIIPISRRDEIFCIAGECEVSETWGSGWNTRRYFDSDADFIAESRTVVPELIAEIKRLLEFIANDISPAWLPEGIRNKRREILGDK